MLGDGRLHLGGIAKLAPHLTQENRDAVLGRAVHKSNRQIEELVAELAPRPDVPATIRKLPAGRVAARPAPAGRIDLAGLGTDPIVGAEDLSPDPGVTPDGGPQASSRAGHFLRRARQVPRRRGHPCRRTEHLFRNG
jgi:hypothetical protein